MNKYYDHLKLTHRCVLLFVWIMSGIALPVVGQITGIKFIPSDYPTITAAVTALNAAGPGPGGVTFNIAANYVETIPATISVTATGTISNPVVFQKDPATQGANPLINSYTTGIYTPASIEMDGIIRLVGSDYITFDGIDVTDNPDNTSNPSTMEYGYALFKQSTSNGCRNITIKNCVITLNNINNAAGSSLMSDGSTGIVSINALYTACTTPLTPVAGGTHSFNRFYGNTISNCNSGIALMGYVSASPFTLSDTNNDIGGNSASTGNTITNFGGAAGAINPAVGIRTLAQYNLTASYNTLNNNNGTGTNHPFTLRGILIGAAASANSAIDFNNITIRGGGTTQTITAIENTAGSTAAANTISISNNIISNGSYGTATTGPFYGIFNNAASPATLLINSNTLSGNSLTAAAGIYYAIYNTGSVTTTLNINDNNFGTAVTPAITFTAQNTAAHIFINNTKGGSSSALSISNNSFYNVSYSVPGTGSNTYILNSAPTRSQVINGNTFNNLNVNTTGNISFLSNNVAVPSTGTQTVNNNLITGTFTKAAGGTVTFYTSSSAASVTGAIINQENNNFSNITLSGATTVTGWINIDAGGSAKTISNNVFSNWVCGTAAVTVMSTSLTSTNNATTANTISNISAEGTITGITTSTGNDRIFSNIIDSLFTTGASTVTGISVLSGTTKNIFNNKIYTLQASNASGIVYGISVTGTTNGVVTANIHNNLIGDLRAPLSNLADAIRGININISKAGTAVNVYYNTIYLNAGSNATNFGTSGIYHAANSTATIGALSLRNNIIANYSSPKGSGLVVALRRSSNVLTNYLASSNNNLLYSGNPSANKLIYYDGVGEPLLSSFKARVASRESQSVTEDLVTSNAFMSTTGSSPGFLHLNAGSTTLAESGAAAIANHPNDYDGQTRHGTGTYQGTGTAPDIGADEFEGKRATSLAGTYTVGLGQTFTSLTNAGGLFASINNLGLSANVIVKITSNLTEDGSNSLNQWTEQGNGNYTVTIEPDASTARIISGNVLNGLIRLNGAKRVIIDGSNGTANSYLTFRNTNPAGSTGTAFTFINGAAFNTIRYCNIEASANLTNGTILFSSSLVAGGNSNNQVSNCNINATVNGLTGTVCIYSAGTFTAGFLNTNNTLSNNNIYDYKERGLDISLSGSSEWIITGNSFYNGDVSATITYSNATVLHAVRILGGAGYSILNNFIGGNAANASGTQAVYTSAGTLLFEGILLTTSGATPLSNIKGNTIANLSVSAISASASTVTFNVFFGIETNGSGINIGGTVAGDGNRVGSNSLNGSIIITTTTSAGAKSTIRGIYCFSTGGIVSGNQVSGIDIRNIGTIPGASAFIGISLNHATASSPVSNNIIGSNGAGAIANSIRVLASSTSVSTSLTGISIASTVTSTILVSGNIVRSLSQQSPSASGAVTGIASAAITPAVVNINNNTISANTVNATAAGFFGIYSNSGNPGSLTITNNTISGNTSTATTGQLFGIYTGTAVPAPSAIVVNNNIVSANTNTTSSGTMAAIFNSMPTPSLSITENTVLGNYTSSASGLFYAIFNSGAVTTSININLNKIGTAISSAITFNAANNGVQNYINNTGGASTAALSVSNNVFNGISHTVTGTGVNTLVSNTAATLSQAINGNLFTNLTLNLSSTITFISNSVIVGATGSQNVNNNAISGTFTKLGSTGTVILFTSTAASASGAVINNNNNNFSNITVSGATGISGWINTDAGNSTKNIQNNIFSNWAAGTGPATGLSVNLAGTSNNTTGNLVNRISGSGPITGISTGTGNDNIYSNIVNTLISAAAAVTGISITGGTTKNIYRNKIYDLQASHASTGTVNGILVSGSTVVSANIYNNLIGDLQTPAANSGTDLIRGISVISTTPNSSINVYYNTVYLNASSSGTNFSSTGIYHIANAIATTGMLNLRNNSITNMSTPKGTGLTVAYRRSGTASGNYANTSDNNLFYAGVPAANRLIYYDGNADPTIAGFKTRMVTRDQSSVTENLSTKFLSTVGSSTLFLHMDNTKPTIIESGAINIAGFTNDFDVQTRAGNTGYSGAGNFPDIGADEVFGIEVVPPAITYTALTDTISTSNRNITGISITDASGINTSPGTRPRIYYKRFSDANAWLDNTPSTNGWKFTEAVNSVSPFDFQINYSLLYGGASVTAGVIQYFITAQDLSTVANVGINSGSFNLSPSSVELTAAAFPLGGTVNSYKIPFSGNFNIGTNEVFSSLTKPNGLFASINSAGLMGNSTFNITSDLAEDGSTALNQWTEAGTGNYLLLIKPDGATSRVIAGDFAGGLIRLNGTDRVTIDGSNNGSGTYLNIKNINTAGSGTAVTFVNGATNNNLRFIEAAAVSNSSTGVIFFSSSATAVGNSNNLIENCTINATIGTVSGETGIYSEGTAGNENTTNTIANNHIIDYRFRGLEITATGSTEWKISGNNFYNGDVSGTPYPAASMLSGIRVLGGAGYLISNNAIGGNDIMATGSQALYASTSGNLFFQGIALTTSSAVPASAIKGNTVASVTIRAAPTSVNAAVFAGITTGGYGISIGGNSMEEGNTIGSKTTNGSINITTSTNSAAFNTVIAGISSTSSGGLINNNQVGGFNISNAGTVPAPSGFQGIYINHALPASQVNNNIIGSRLVPHSIGVLPASGSARVSLTGIEIGADVNAAIQVEANYIENISNLSNTSSGSFTGIKNLATSSGAAILINRDTIQQINTSPNNSTGSAVYSGIESGSAAVITNNLINNITASSTGINSQVIGMHVTGAYAATVSNNRISNLYAASGKTLPNAESGSPAGAAIIGILNASSAAGQVISNNLLSGLTATSKAAIDVVITGIGVTSTGSGNIYNNRFGTFTNIATGSSPAICHIMAAGGNFNVYNNTLRLSNLTNTNGMKIFGIIHSSPTAWNYFHNTVRISGSVTGTAMRSAAFLLSGNSSPVLKNNIFFNIRTGAGFHYAVSNLGAPPSNWGPEVSDYNNFYSINTSTVAEWGANAGQTFVQWQGLTGGDAHSISNSISFINSTYDLQPDSITNCNFNKAGTPVTSPVVVDKDINNNARSTVSPDLGAYEFNYTGFSIVAGSNSPVCAGDSLLLTVEPGESLIPRYSWRNPANTLISTYQNPTVVLVAGIYKITVTDSTGCSVTDSTLVTINQRPTATLSSATSVCDSGMVNMLVNVTGTGAITGSLSNGDEFSGAAPTITIPLSVTATTAFSVISLSDESCTSIQADLPDTITVTVTHKGDWLGITSNWHDAVNWCEGIVPVNSTDVTIPAGTMVMPVITDSAFCRNLIINFNDTLTIASTGILSISGLLTNYGEYNDNGTTMFTAISGQQTFSGVRTFNNLKLNNTGGLLLPVSVIIKNDLTLASGTLNSSNFNITISGSWTNNFSPAAFTAGTGTVSFNSSIAAVINGSHVTTFNNVAVVKTAATLTLFKNAGITGNLIISGGILDLSTFTANRTTPGGTISVANNATLKIGGTNTFPASFTTSNLIIASTVEYSGTNQTVGNQLYGNLVLSSSGGAAVKLMPATPLVIAGNLTSTSGNESTVTFTAGAAINVNGNVLLDSSTTMNGGAYVHTIGGNFTNNGTFTGNTSTIQMNGSNTVVSGAGKQNFHSLTISASGVSFSGDTIALTGNLATALSGTFSQATGSTLIMAGTGSIISGSGISLNNLQVTGTVATTASFTIKGNLLVDGELVATGGTITMSGILKTIAGTGTTALSSLFSSGSVTVSNNFSISSALIVNGRLDAVSGTATFTSSSILSGTANLFNVSLDGTSLQLSTKSVLGIAGVFAIINGSLDVTGSAPNTVNFNSTGPQNVNALVYSNLLLSGGSTKTATGNIETLYDITIGATTLFNPASHTISVSGNWLNYGTFLPATSTVQFLGNATAFIDGATTFNILTSNSTNSSTELLLKSNVSASVVNMMKGQILTGTNTLTITATRTGTGIILGNIQRTHAFITGTAYAFEGPDNTITFSAVSSVSSITVSVTKGLVSDFPFGGSISRVYNISVPSGTYTATLRMHYEDDETNGNNEASMSLWHYNGTGWTNLGKTSNDITLNYVEKSGLTDITNRWTFSDNANLVHWNGSVSSDWNNAANWTIIQGAASAPPAASDIVDLGTGTFTHQPVISSSVTVKNIIFGSAKAVTLTLAAGGSLTTLGDITGTWQNNASHNILVNDQDLMVQGSLILSDGTPGHDINLQIGSGNVTSMVSVVESGAAGISFTGTGTLNIFKDFDYSSGTFTAGTGTVNYNGTENQHLGNVDYKNLGINKSSGIARVDSVLNIGGNLLIASGELNNFSIMTIAGNVTIEPAGILINSRVVHVHGNWTNTGTYTSTGSNIFFDGSGTQSISSSTFNNLHIIKPVNSVAVLTGNVIITGNLTVNSGTLDIKTFDCNRSVMGGIFTLGDSATFIVGGNNPPANFSGGSLSNSSTVIADGTIPQIIFGESFGHLIFRNSGAKTLVSPITINGDLTIENGAVFDGGSNTITINGNWYNSGTFTPSSSKVSATGIDKVISGNNVFNEFSVTGSYTFLNNNTFNGLLDIGKTGSLTGGPSIHTLLHGDLLNAGILYTLGTTTFSGNVQQTFSLVNAVQTVAVTVNFNGSVSPVLNSTSAPQYGYLNINNTAGIHPSVGWTVLYALTIGQGASFNGGISTHNIIGTLTNNGNITSSGTLNFLPASPVTLDLGNDFTSTGTVVFGGSGAITLAGNPVSFQNVVLSNTNSNGVSPSSNWMVTKHFTINTNTLFNAGAYSYSIGGDLHNSGTLMRGSSTFSLNGAGSQDISSTTPFHNVTINKTGGQVTMSSDIAEYGILHFVSGKIKTGNNFLFISSTGSITGAGQGTGWINGNLRKNVAIGTNIIRTFEVGDSIHYSPVSVILANVTSSGDLTNKATPWDHPQLAGTDFDPGKTINRFFTITNTGTTYSKAAITFNWVATDVDPGTVTSALAVQSYNGASWKPLTTSSALPLSINVTDVMAFGDFAIGQFAIAIWTGSLNNDWFSQGNWSSGVPLLTGNASIPGSLVNYPVVNAGTVTVQNISIQSGASITINNAVMQISGSIVNNGSFNAANGTIEMKGNTPQVIPSHSFSGNVVRNLTVSNLAGVTLLDSLLVTGILLAREGDLESGGHLTLVSTSLQTALIDGSGSGNVRGKVTMQRYLPSGFGYRYISSPFESALVGELAGDINLAGSFPPIYRYDENALSSGWTKYNDSSGRLIQAEGYAANFGSSASPKTIDISGIVANGGIASHVLYNHNRQYTRGFNLVGNPYPSPIDWNAPTGWDRSNIDDAVYYFNTGGADQYTGTYSTYINGVSSDGTANSIIGSMQGFFVHVSNGTFPVTASLNMNNNVRVNNLSPNFYRRVSFTGAVLRLSASFADETRASDPVAVYFEPGAKKEFEQDMDALKLFNTDSLVPNLYAIAPNASRLSINAWPELRDSTEIIPLGLQLKRSGYITFQAHDIKDIAPGRDIYLFDAKTNTYHNLRKDPSLRLHLAAGEYENRFSLIFSLKELHTSQVAAELFNIYSAGSKLFVNSHGTGAKMYVLVHNLAGQEVHKQELSGNGNHQLSASFTSGIYIVSVSTGKTIVSKKIFIAY